MISLGIRYFMHDLICDANARGPMLHNVSDKTQDVSTPSGIISPYLAMHSTPKPSFKWKFK